MLDDMSANGASSISANVRRRCSNSSSTNTSSPQAMEPILNEREKELQKLVLDLIASRQPNSPPQPSADERALQAIKPHFSEWLEIKYAIKQITSNKRHYRDRRNISTLALSLDQLRERCETAKRGAIAVVTTAADGVSEQFLSFSKWLSDQIDIVTIAIVKLIATNTPAAAADKNENNKSA